MLLTLWRSDVTFDEEWPPLEEVECRGSGCGGLIEDGLRSPRAPWKDRGSQVSISANCELSMSPSSRSLKSTQYTTQGDNLCKLDPKPSTMTL